MYPPNSFYHPVAPSSNYSHAPNVGTYPSILPTSLSNGWVPALGNDQVDGMPNPMPSPERYPFDAGYMMNSTPSMVSDPFGMPHGNVQQSSFVAYHGTTPTGGPVTPGFPPPINYDYNSRYEEQYQGSFPIPSTHAVNSSSDPRKHRTGQSISIGAQPDEQHQGPLLSAYTIGSQSNNRHSHSATSSTSANVLTGHKDHNSPQASQPSRALSGFMINEGNYGTINGGLHDYLPLNNDGSIRHIVYDSNSGNRIKDEVLTREEYLKIVLSASSVIS